MEDLKLEIKKTETETSGEYFAEVNGARVAEMAYSKSPGRIIISHTDVTDPYRGTGLGRKLVDKAVQDARELGFKILPLCPYARSVFKKDESIRDVLN